MADDASTNINEMIHDLVEKLQIKDLLLDAGSEGVAITEKGKVLFVNKQITKMLGYENPELLIGESVAKFVSPRSQELVMENIRNNLSIPYESFSIRKDGSEFATLTFARSSQFQGRNVRITTIRDITEFYNSRKMLETSEKRYRSLFNQIPITIWEEDASELVKYTKELGLENIEKLDNYLYDNPDIVKEALSKLRVVNVNETALDLLNVSDKEILINSLPRFFSNKAIINYRKSIIAFVKKKKYFEMESEFIKSTGEIIDIQVIWSVIPGYEDTYSKIVTVITDITSKKKAELEREEMESTFEEMQKLDSLGTFARGIAHDFNNLLVGILGNAILAINQVLPGSSIFDLLTEIKETSIKASNLTKQLQAYSGSGKITKELFNLNDLIEEMQDFMNLTIPSNIGISKFLSTTDPWIEADRTQIRQIVINLLINASESMEDGGIITLKTFHITKESLKTRSGIVMFNPIDSAYYTCLEISDSGKGIERSIIPKIFDPFYSNKSSGKGLGLSVVQGIIKGHEGGLILDSKVNEGTCFLILFPLSMDYKSVQYIEKLESTDSTIVPEGKILVVDDEPVVLSVASKLLNKIGFEALSALGGEEAINTYRENSDVRVVILDLTLKKMTGKQIFIELRKINPLLPIVISSGFDKKDIIAQFEGEERVGVLQKPYSSDELKHVILSLI